MMITRRRFFAAAASFFASLALPKVSFATPSWWSSGWLQFNPRKMYGAWLELPPNWSPEIAKEFKDILVEQIKVFVWPGFRQRITWVEQPPAPELGREATIGWKYMPWRPHPLGKRIYESKIMPDGSTRLSVYNEHHEKRFGWFRKLTSRKRRDGSLRLDTDEQFDTESGYMKGTLRAT